MQQGLFRVVLAIRTLPEGARANSCIDARGTTIEHHVWQNIVYTVEYKAT